MKFLDKFKKKKEQELGGTVVEGGETKESKGKKAEKAPKAKKAETKAPVKTAKTAKVLRAQTTRVILTPIISEKSATLASQGQYMFKVESKANRIQVRNAFKELYGVLPTGVNIQRIRQDRVRFGRIRGKQKSWKKAIVFVPKGKEIKVYEGV